MERARASGVDDLFDWSGLFDEGSLTFDVFLAVASCDSDQILGGVFLASCGALSASSSDRPP